MGLLIDRFYQKHLVMTHLVLTKFDPCFSLSIIIIIKIAHLKCMGPLIDRYSKKH